VKIFNTILDKVKGANKKRLRFINCKTISGVSFACLNPDGTFANYGNYQLKAWKDIVSFSEGSAWSFLVALKYDGTVLATGQNEKGQCNINQWEDIVEIATGFQHTVGLKSDGTVLATGSNEYKQCDVMDWTDIIAIAACNAYTLGLKSDGTVVAAGSTLSIDVSQWKGITAIAAGGYHALGLKPNGRVVATGKNRNGECDVDKWKNIMAISAGHDHSVGLRQNRTVVATGSNHVNKCEVSSWKDVEEIAAGLLHTTGRTLEDELLSTGNISLKSRPVEKTTQMETNRYRVDFDDSTLVGNSISKMQNKMMRVPEDEMKVANNDLDTKTSSISEKGNSDFLSSVQRSEMQLPSSSPKKISELTSLLLNHPISITDRSQLHNLLKDFYPNQPLQVNLLIHLYDLDIHRELASNSSNISNRFTKKLADNYGTSAEHAKWAIDTWIEAYENIN